MSDYVDKQIQKLKKDSKEKKKSQEEYNQKLKNSRIENEKYFELIYSEKEEEFLKLVEYLKQEFKETDIRAKSLKSGDYQFQIWIQKENRIIDIVNLNTSKYFEKIEVEIHDPDSTNLLDDGIIKEFKPRDKDKAFQYFIDKITEASKRIK